MLEKLSDRQLSAMDRLILDADKVGPDAPCTIETTARVARMMYDAIADGDGERAKLEERIEEIESDREEFEEEVEDLKTKLRDKEVDWPKDEYTIGTPAWAADLANRICRRIGEVPDARDSEAYAMEVRTIVGEETRKAARIESQNPPQPEYIPRNPNRPTPVA